MLFTFTLFLFCTIAIIVAVHYGALFLFLKRLRQTEWQKPSADFCPKTMVLFPLRGADPMLSQCLKKILTQDYPNYHIQFLLDSADDPALPFVEKAITQHKQEGRGAPHAEIKIVDEHLLTCSLKCCALYHGTVDLDPSFEVVVVLDADSHLPSDWLKRLIEPLADPHFPAATGLRWYIPEQAHAGSLVRYLWNAAAVVQQDLYQIPWGGSLALRRDLLKESNLLEQWKHALADDTVVMSAVRQINRPDARRGIAIVPSLFLVNKETCTLRSFHRWVKRQMLSAKLYHPAWGAVLAQAVLITLPLVLLVGTFCTGLIVQEGKTILWSLIAFVFYWGGVFGTLPIMEHAIRHIVRHNGETVKRWSFYRTMFTFVMVPITQATYTSALFWLHFLRKIEWRGVEYEVIKKRVRLIEYKPYTAAAVEEGHSL